MTTVNRKMILLHSADDNAIIICDPKAILYVAPSLTSLGFTKVRFHFSGNECYLNVHETPEEIAHLADWLISAGISSGDAL